MKPFRALTLTVVRASFRNRVALLFTLGLAFLFMLIFGELFGGTGATVKIDVVNLDQGAPTAYRAASVDYARALKATRGLKIKYTKQSKALKDLKNDDIDAVVEIPAGFGRALAGEGPPARVHLLEASDTSSASSITYEVVGQVTARFHAGGSATPAVSLAPPQLASVRQVTAIDFFLPAMIAYIVLQSGINYVAIGLVDLRVRQVLRRFRATPLKRSTILASQVTGSALTVVLQILVLVAVGLTLFRAHSYGNWLLVALVTGLGVVAFVGIGFMLTSAAKTSEAARGLATMIALPMMFLSGIFFPIDDLPGWVQGVIHVLPLAWLSDALHQVMNNAAGFGTIAGDCGILAAWAVVTFAIATARFRWE
jgi:ABC-2 type transport system permease protein